MTCFQSSTPQFTCALAKASLCSFMQSVIRGFRAFTLEGSWRSFRQQSWIFLMLTLARAGMLLFSLTAVMLGCSWILFLISLLVSWLIFLGLPETGFLGGTGKVGFFLAKARSLLRVD